MPSRGKNQGFLRSLTSQRQALTRVRILSDLFERNETKSTFSAGAYFFLKKFIYSLVVTGCMKKAVYAGSFDPPTNGHLWMIEKGSKLFDKLIVAIGDNPDKKYNFSVKERKCMLEEIIKEYPNTSTCCF